MLPFSPRGTINDDFEAVIVAKAAFAILFGTCQQKHSVLVGYDVSDCSTGRPLAVDPSRKLGDLLGDFAATSTDAVVVERSDLPGFVTACREPTFRLLFIDEPLGLEARRLPSTVVLRRLATANGNAVTIDEGGSLVEKGVLELWSLQLQHLENEISKASLEQPLEDLDMICSRDISQIWQWNKLLPQADPQTLGNLLHAASCTHPARTAVYSNTRSFTYRELDDVTGRLAAYLRKSQRLRVGERAVLCFDKSVEAIIATLSIIKTGAAFVPTDPSHPTERLRTIVAESAAKVVITAHQHADRFRGSDNDIIEISDDFLSTLPDDGVVCMPSVDPEDPAYMIYTSGSTGKPKGVVVPHRAIAATLKAFAEALELEDTCPVIQFCSYAFDVYILDLCLALTRGGCLHIMTEEERLNDFGSVVKRAPGAFTCLTPSFARSIDPLELEGLSTLAIGSEEVLLSDITRLPKSISVHVGYGPSECAVVAAVTRNGKVPPPSKSLGHPIASAAWIVDPRNRNKLLPLGAVGELLIEGPIVGSGYWNDPEKTAAAFIEPPSWLSTIASRNIGRLYKTGDLARLTPTGSLAFVGRTDHQVKVRGHRVDLGEIEQNIRAVLNGVSDVAVEVAHDGDMQPHPVIMAFVMRPDGNRAHSQLLLHTDDKLTRHLRSQLANRLPSYMVPDYFLDFEEFPLSISSKVDRASLRRAGAKLILQSRLPGTAESFRQGDPPTTKTATESTLLCEWAKLLPGIAFDLTSNFFACGADSLIAIRLARALRANGLSLSVSDIFHNPSLQQMAKKLGENNAFSKMSTVTPYKPLSLIEDPVQTKAEVSRFCGLKAYDIEDILPCTPFQEAVVTVSTRLPDMYFMQYEMPIPDNAGDAAILKAWETISKGDPALRSYFAEVSAGLVQVIAKSDVAKPSVKVRQQSRSSYLEADRQKGMRLGSRFARVAVVIDGSSRHVIMSLHHAVADRWSVSQMTERLWSCLLGRPFNHPLSPATLVQYLRNMNGENSANFWKDHLDGVQTSEFPTLPFQKSQPMTSACIRHAIVGCPKPTGPVTEATVIKASWALLVGKYTMSEDVVFGTTVNGRTLAVDGIEDMAGPSIATIPVRVRLPVAGTTVDEYLKMVQDESAAAMPHEQIGLHAIGSVSPDASRACNFRNLLIVEKQSLDETSCLAW